MHRPDNDTMTPGDIHDHRDLTIRARLEKATGSSANQVIWVADRPAERAKPAIVDCSAHAGRDDEMARRHRRRSVAATPGKVVEQARDAVDAYGRPTASG